VTDDPAGLLVDLMRRSASGLVDGMYVTLPAVVERYDATRQCVDAQPTIMRERQGEDGETIVDRLPVVSNAPVVFMGSGGYRDTFPIEVGSLVLLHFTSAAMDRWLSIGGKDVEPQDTRRHDATSAFAVPGGHSFGGSTAPGTTAPTDARVLHAPTGGLIRAGGPAAVIAPTLASEVAALKAAIAAWIPVAGDGGESLKAVFAAWSAPGASKVRVE
jgi:hypothetical protein